MKSIVYFLKWPGTLFVTCLLISIATAAQTEFSKGFIAHIRLSSGMVTNLNSLPPLFIGSVEFMPQMTVIEHRLRAGAVVGAFYTNKIINGLFGPSLSVKVVEFQGGDFGSLGNVNVSVDHLWGTGNQKLLGTGVNADILNRLVVSILANRDYAHHAWWIKTGIAVRISKVKKVNESFPH